MYLTAHRPGSGLNFFPINSYLYLHEITWVQLPPILPEPRWVREHVATVSNARQLRSYLDIVAPDDVNLDEVNLALNHLLGVVESGQHSPWTRTCGRVQVTFDLEQGLAPAWRAELAQLSDAARNLWIHPAYATGSI